MSLRDTTPSQAPPAPQETLSSQEVEGAGFALAALAHRDDGVALGGLAEPCRATMREALGYDPSRLRALATARPPAEDRRPLPARVEGLLGRPSAEGRAMIPRVGFVPEPGLRALLSRLATGDRRGG